MIGQKKSLDEEGTAGKSKVLSTSRRMMKDMQKFWVREGLGLKCTSEYLGDDGRVIEWKRKGEQVKAGQNMNQCMEAMESVTCICMFPLKKVLGCGHEGGNDERSSFGIM